MGGQEWPSGAAAGDRPGRRPKLGLPVAVAVAAVLLVALSLLDRGDRDATVLLTERYDVGDCVDWDQSSDPADDHQPVLVGCDEPHLEEVAAVIDLTHLRRYPSEEGWDRIVARRCHPAIDRYLGFPVDNGPMSLLATGRIKPVPASWHGDLRRLVCTVSRRQVDTALHARQVRRVYRGRAVDQQGLDYAVGDCLRMEGRIGRVACDRPHQVEVTKVVDLSGLARPPADEDGWWELLGAPCSVALGDVLAGRVPDDVWIGSEEPSDEQWRAGTRQALCLAGRVRDGDWVTVRQPLG